MTFRVLATFPVLPIELEATSIALALIAASALLIAIVLFKSLYPFTALEITPAKIPPAKITGPMALANNVKATTPF